MSKESHRLLSSYLLKEHAWHKGEDRTVPEMGIATNHAKMPRILNGMCLEYSILLPYLKPGDHVLDLCAGAGLGTQIFVDSGYKVTAIDRSVDCLEHRSGVHKIIKMDILKASIPGTYDACAWNEGIEHFHLPDQHKILGQLVKAVTGHIVIGTPLSVAEGKKNRSHLHEHTWDSFGKIISQYFTIVKRYNLDWIASTFMSMLEGWDGVHGHSTAQVIVARSK